MILRLSIALVCVMGGMLAQPHSSNAQRAQPNKPTTSENDASESNRIRIFRLQNLPAPYAEAAITPMLGADSETILTADEYTNSLLARGTEEDLKIIEAMIINLDSDPPKEKASTDDEMHFVTYELKYAAADEASTLLGGVLRQSRGNSLRISPDKRLNRLLVYGNRMHHKEIQELLQEIDAPNKSGESKVLKFESSDKKSTAWARLLMGAANDAGVELDIMPEMDMAVVRGTKEAVSSFSGSANELLKSVDGASNETTGTPRDVIVSCVWFVISEEPTVLPKRYEAVARRASQFGMNNLSLASQVMARAQAGTKPTAFHVGGMVEDSYQIECEGEMQAGTNGQVRLDINLQVLEPRVHANAHGGAQASSQAHVQMQVTPGKPTIIASTPVKGLQSLFVIEVLADEQ